MIRRSASLMIFEKLEGKTKILYDNQLTSPFLLVVNQFKHTKGLQSEGGGSLVVNIQIFLGIKCKSSTK